MTALARPAAIVKGRPILSSEMLHEDYDRRCSVDKEMLVVSLEGFGAKANLLAVNC
jgi:hypothetical protein